MSKPRTMTEPRIRFPDTCPRCNFNHPGKVCPRCADTRELDTEWAPLYTKIVADGHDASEPAREETHECKPITLPEVKVDRGPGSTAQ